MRTKLFTKQFRPIRTGATARRVAGVAEAYGDRMQRTRTEPATECAFSRKLSDSGIKTGDQDRRHGSGGSSRVRTETLGTNAPIRASSASAGKLSTNASRRLRDDVRSCRNASERRRPHESAPEQGALVDLTHPRRSRDRAAWPRGARFPSVRLSNHSRRSRNSKRLTRGAGRRSSSVVGPIMVKPGKRRVQQLRRPGGDPVHLVHEEDVALCERGSSCPARPARRRECGPAVRRAFGSLAPRTRG